MTRNTTITRTTKETDILVSLDLEGGRKNEISTGVGFFDHMLNSFAFHSGFSLNLKTTGDLFIDAHHTVEDTGIALGQAFKTAIGDKIGIERFGSALVPMDEALCGAVVDISGRPFLVFDDEKLCSLNMDGFDPFLVEEFFRAFTFNADITLHLEIKSGKNPHHIIEGLFKAFARSLRQASAITGTGLPSTKGAL